jgi:hypothetical protein
MELSNASAAVAYLPRFLALITLTERDDFSVQVSLQQFFGKSGFPIVRPSRVAGELLAY